MFLNTQKPGLMKDPYIYKPDSIMFDLEDAVAGNQKDAARFSLYHGLKTIDYRGCERVVRINALDTPYWQEDIRCAVAAGCDAVRIPKTESALDVKRVEKAVESAEIEFARYKGSVLIMAAIESAKGVMKALEICEASERLFPGAIIQKICRHILQGPELNLWGLDRTLLLPPGQRGSSVLIRYLRILTIRRHSGKR